MPLPESDEGNWRADASDSQDDSESIEKLSSADDNRMTRIAMTRNNENRNDENHDEENRRDEEQKTHDADEEESTSKDNSSAREADSGGRRKT